MPRQKNPEQICLRCGWVCSKESTRKRHIQTSRVAPCKATRADVPAKWVDISDSAVVNIEGDNNHVTNNNVTNHNQCTFNNINSDQVTVNNTTTHHHHHHHSHTSIHVHQQLVPMQETDLSHIPEHVWGELARIAADDAAGAMRLYVRMVHFNPCQPSNMSVYHPPGSSNTAIYERKHDGKKGWSWLPSDEAHDSLLATRTADILAKMPDDGSRKSFEDQTAAGADGRTAVLAVVKGVTSDGSTDVFLMHRERLPPSAPAAAAAGAAGRGGHGKPAAAGAAAAPRPPAPASAPAEAPVDDDFTTDEDTDSDDDDLPKVVRDMLKTTGGK